MYIQEKFNCCMRTMLCKEVAEGVATYDKLYARGSLASDGTIVRCAKK